MTVDFTTHLMEVLKQDKRMFTESGHFLRNVAVELGYKADVDLLRLLLGDITTKEHFFTDVDGTMVFDSQRFGWVVNNREFFPDSYTRFQNAIGLVDSQGRSIAQGRDTELVWPSKDCVLEGGQTKEDEKREEVFYNETLAPDQVDRLLAPKVLGSATRYDKKGSKPTPDFSDDDNLIIKGNNLLALVSLKKRFAGKVQTIYIDPPFNTERDDFRYNDRFTRSTWLTFMKTRLQVAYELLREDGNFFIHINDEQYPYVAILANEVFGEGNYVDTIIWSYGSASGGRAAGAKLVGVHDYILHFAKKRPQRVSHKIFTPYSDKYVTDWFKWTDKDGRRYRQRMRDKDEHGNNTWEKQYLDESPGVPGTTVWYDTVWSDIKQIYADPRAYKEDQKQHSEITGYDTQKPEKLLQRLLEHTTKPGDIVLDFFAGSGTTGAVAHKMGRKWILIEQLDEGLGFLIPRLEKILAGDKTGISKDVDWKGGGSFVYCQLAKLNQTYAERIRDAKKSEDLLGIWEEIKDTGFVSYRVRPEDFKVKDFTDLSLEDQKKLLMETLDKNLLYVNLYDIDDADYQVSDDDKAFTHSFYGELER